MATHAEWAGAYARQAEADFGTFEAIQPLPVPECHKLLFLQMACEKLVKAHLCGEGTDPASLQKSHAYVANTLPVVLRQYLTHIEADAREASKHAQRFTKARAREVLKHAKHLSQEIDVLAPAVKRGGKRPDNCEYPWADAGGNLHVPLDWSFTPSQLLVLRAGRTFLKLIRGAIDRLLQGHAS